ncbi:c-type cytochrome, partial [Thermodesulfobacteriota bacterium]
AGIDLISPFKMEDSTITARGKAVFLTFCAQCHGYNYDGNGTVGQSFKPLPADLRSSKVQATSEGELFKSISYGIPGGRQPALETTVTIDDRWHVVAFIKSLGKR